MKRVPIVVHAVLASLVAMTGACGMDNMMPNPPSELMAAEVSEGAHLTWRDNSDNEASFMIERMEGTSPYTALATVPFDTTAYHDAPLTAGVTYMYRVMATPKSGEHGSATKYSNEVTFTLAAP